MASQRINTASASKTPGQGEYASIRRIVVEFIPQDQQRVPGLGDWFYDFETLHVRASGETEVEAFLIALHEQVEAMLCRRAGISQVEVDDHDILFEEERARGDHGEDDEPGDDPRAPYRDQHRFAMLVEHLTARELGFGDYGTVR